MENEKGEERNYDNVGNIGVTTKEMRDSREREEGGILVRFLKFWPEYAK